jgi:hypothetical protein
VPSQKNLMDPTSRGHYHHLDKEQEPALVHDELIVDGRKNPSNEKLYQGPTIRKKLNELISQRKEIEEQRAVTSFGHSPTSLRNSSHNKDLHRADPVSNSYT